ncbi:hypothetical protein LCGC14_1029970 [marine sediment metagenome]|jgi:hypothetical protein|uniref:Uncharacterized protein n=1 Tax=marine sediment metagenome TaxID=412755 RepID=A0A0F9R0R9_9ZZZZ|nr:hypothetical protein [Candidatus Aminicenantes bacterium]
MKGKTTNLEQKSKKTYTKPELKQIPLRPQESVLGFCKNDVTYGPVISTCENIGLVCQTLGS